MTLVSHLVLLASLTTGEVPPEAAEVDALARTLRIQIYDTFRTDRAEFERRRQEGQRVLDAWHAAGDHSKDRPLVVDWYQRAVRASQPGSIAPLPASPQFGVRNETVSPIVETPRATVPMRESPQDPARVETPYHDATPEASPPPPAAEPPPEAPAPSKPLTDQPTANPPAVPEKRHLQISLVELSARLAGYNRGLQAVENKLSQRASTSAELKPLVKDLADLARRNRDLSLYREYVVSDSERATLPTPAPLTDVLALLGDHIFAARQAANAADYGSEPQRQAELDQLDALSRQLAEIATYEQTATGPTHVAIP